MDNQNLPPTIAGQPQPTQPAQQAGTPIQQPPDQKTVDAMLAVMQAQAAQDSRREAAVKSAADSHGFIYRYIAKLVAPFNPAMLAENPSARPKAIFLGLLYLAMIIASIWSGSLL